MNKTRDSKSEADRDSISSVRRRLVKLAIYVPPAIMGAALFDISAAAGDDKKKKKETKVSCAPHVCEPHSHHH